MTADMASTWCRGAVLVGEPWRFSVALCAVNSSRSTHTGTLRAALAVHKHVGPVHGKGTRLAWLGLFFNSGRFGAVM